LAFIVFTSTSVIVEKEIVALDVIHSSEKSIFFVISLNLSFKSIFNSASKLDPISLLALFSSILILQIFLILINSCHLLFKASF